MDVVGDEVETGNDDDNDIDDDDDDDSVYDVDLCVNAPNIRLIGILLFDV